MLAEELFKGTAHYYSRYRLGYPPEVFNYLVESFSLNGQGRLLDLGCGTGQLIIPLAKHFQEAIGLDPEEEMLSEAKRQASGIDNIKFILARAEEITKDFGLFRLAVMGNSFHWMNQKEVLEKLYPLIEKGGGIAVISDSSSPWQVTGEKWKEVRKEIIQKYLGKERRAGKSFYQGPQETFESLLENSPFGNCKAWTYEYLHHWSLEAVINILYSTSFASRQLFGENLSDFEKELESSLLKLEPEGIFEEKIKIQVLISFKQGVPC